MGGRHSNMEVGLEAQIIFTSGYHPCAGGHQLSSTPFSAERVLPERCVDQARSSCATSQWQYGICQTAASRRRWRSLGTPCRWRRARTSIGEVVDCEGGCSKWYHCICAITSDGGPPCYMMTIIPAAAYFMVCAKFSTV